MSDDSNTPPRPALSQCCFEPCPEGGQLGAGPVFIEPEVLAHAVGKRAAERPGWEPGHVEVRAHVHIAHLGGQIEGVRVAIVIGEIRIGELEIRRAVRVQGPRHPDPGPEVELSKVPRSQGPWTSRYLRAGIDQILVDIQGPRGAGGTGPEQRVERCLGVRFHRGVETVGRAPRDAQRDIESAVLSAVQEPAIVGIEGARSRPYLGPVDVFRGLRDDVDHPGKGVRAVHGRAWPSDDLDPLDVVDLDVVELGEGVDEEPLSDRDVVEEDQDP